MPLSASTPRQYQNLLREEPDNATLQGQPKRRQWRWVPSLYFAEGLPYAIVTVVSVVFFKRLGLSNADATLYTGWLYLPWVIKPLWSPWIDLLKTKRYWILITQFCLGAGFAGVALTIPADAFVQYTLVFFWLIAFCSATHDIAADGYYMLALSPSNQAWFVGIRNSFFRAAWVSGQGLLVVAAGLLEQSDALGRNVPLAWSLTFLIAAGIFLMLALYHTRALPKPAADASRSIGDRSEVLPAVIATFASFFRQANIGYILAFLLLFRFAEAQIARIAAPFLLDERTDGGLGLSTAEVGVATGVTGVLMLLLGGLLGGFCAAQNGLKRWLPWMVAAINLPNLVYVALAYAQPENLSIVHLSIAVEQFGYGFGFTAYLLFMIHVADGPHKTAHYAICTGFMALGMMLPGMFSGTVQEALGYPSFFVWIMLATIPSFVVAWLVPLEDDFGKKPAEEVS